ncbi:unnamed protein product [Strongylus vulgaris]|uniref:Uncharacterized protein n=1 Tax=Strongylus vulgaris TaxID=40348 RepID=A0A3P7KW22_STRVU|nr:unnamed protein product [Strongylus vulgaris]
MSKLFGCNPEGFNSGGVIDGPGVDSLGATGRWGAVLADSDSFSKKRMNCSASEAPLLCRFLLELFPLTALRT